MRCKSDSDSNCTQDTELDPQDLKKKKNEEEEEKTGTNHHLQTRTNNNEEVKKVSLNDDSSGESDLGYCKKEYECETKGRGWLGFGFGVGVRMAWINPRDAFFFFLQSQKVKIWSCVM